VGSIDLEERVPARHLWLRLSCPGRRCRFLLLTAAFVSFGLFATALNNMSASGTEMLSIFVSQAGVANLEDQIVALRKQVASLSTKGGDFYDQYRELLAECSRLRREAGESSSYEDQLSPIESVLETKYELRRYEEARAFEETLRRLVTENPGPPIPIEELKGLSADVEAQSREENVEHIRGYLYAIQTWIEDALSGTWPPTQFSPSPKTPIVDIGKWWPVILSLCLGVALLVAVQIYFLRRQRKRPGPS